MGINHALPSVNEAETICARAEALLLAGHNTEAELLVERALVTELEEETRIKLNLILGSSLFERGKVKRSLQLLRSVMEDARGGSVALQFSTTLAVLAREVQFQTPNEFLPLLSRSRQLGAALGNASSLTGLHSVVARTEAYRGNCVTAERHIEIARRLASSSATPMARCTIEFVDASLQVIAGNLLRSRSAALRGLELAKSAHVDWAKACAFGNLGHLALLWGNVDRAREYLNQALSLNHESPFLRIGVFDSLAQAAFYEQDLDECHRKIDSCREAIATLEVPSRTWYDLAHQLTRCTLLSLFEDWQQILEIVEAADGELERRQFRSLRASLLCARARALAGLERHTQADNVLATALRVCPRGAAEPLINWEAAKAFCLARRGETAMAGVHCERALAASRAIGNRLQERMITADRDTGVRRHSLVLPARSLAMEETGLLVGDVATILRSGHSIDLLAHRLTALVETTRLSSRFSVQNDPLLSEHEGPEVSWNAKADGSWALELQDGERRILFNFSHIESLDEISLLRSIVELAQAAVSRTADGDSEEGDQSLWPTLALPESDDAVFWSPRMAELRRIAIRLAATDIPILITGETGTGKEVIARLIHTHSLVRSGPFIAFNCSALPKDLVESQLFGHRRGAFTGAVDAFPGVIRAAERGTLFMDEIADLDPAVQPKLLRFLESAEVHPVGESRPQHVKVRIVAATNMDIDTLVEQGRFRRDLMYRVGVAKICLPPLRERKDEIPALTSLFVNRLAQEQHRSGLSVGDDFIAALLMYDWPGNIRQLLNELRRVVAMAEDGQTLHACDLEPDIARSLRTAQLNTLGQEEAMLTVRLDQPLDRAIEEVERMFIERAMQASSGHVAEAAKLLGISRKGLFLKRRRWGIGEAS